MWVHYSRVGFFKFKNVLFWHRPGHSLLQFSMTCECFVLIILSESKQIIDKWLEEKHQSCPNSPKLFIKTVEHFWNKIKNIYKKYLEMFKIWILKFKIFIITVFNFFSKNTTILHKIPYFLRKKFKCWATKAHVFELEAANPA